MAAVVQASPRNRFRALGNRMYFCFLTFLDERNNIPVGSSNIHLGMGGGAVGCVGTANDDLRESGGGDRYRNRTKGQGKDMYFHNGFLSTGKLPPFLGTSQVPKLNEYTDRPRLWTMS